ncbi:hypothetical protein ACIPWY_09515 [Streptomyces sp. NPDC090032]|uniref:hypothetical protein n=1 Tax=Streptomyces sp. NPDC090032 TaxID=3365925 RepID=UPI0037FBC3BA
MSITQEISTVIKASVDEGADGPAPGPRTSLSRAGTATPAVLVGPVKGRFLVAAQRAAGAVAPHREAALDDLAALVGRALFVTRDGPRPLDPTDAAIAAIAAIAARRVVGAILARVESRLEGNVDLSREEVSARAVTAAVAIVEALGGGAGL